MCLEQGMAHSTLRQEGRSAAIKFLMDSFS